MNIALWAVAGILAVAFLAAGAMKATKPKQAIIDSGMGWAEDFSPAMIKVIGIAEVLGAIGLILPPLVDVAPILSPIAALALAGTMAGAVAVHAKRKEPVAPALVLGLASLFVGVGRLIVGF